MKANKVASVSDVSLGYACPQVADLQVFLMREFEAEEGLVLEPDQTERPLQHRLFPEFQTVRVYTTQPPWCGQWMIEYNQLCAERLNEFEPDVLVIYQPHTFPLLSMLKKRPKCVIFYQLEMPEYYGFKGIYEQYHRQLNKYVDMVLFPEENRRIKYIQKYGMQGIESAVIYNAPISRFHGESIIKEKCRIVYTGTIDEELTFSNYYTCEDSQRFPIDIFGMFNKSNREHLEKLYGALYQNVRYMGYVSADVLAEIRREYAYGLVSWNPVSDNYLYAAPNKFFEYIQDGVVPIAAPHPQCKKIIERYKCGILMDDWKYESFVKAICYAIDIYGTSTYENMVKNCGKAFREELNWQKQMEKLRPYLTKYKD
jgi:glycosyltransferase involved in cell wall biosynthesis